MNYVQIKHSIHFGTHEPVICSLNTLIKVCIRNYSFQVRSFKLRHSHVQGRMHRNQKNHGPGEVALNLHNTMESHQPCFALLITLG